MKFIDFIDKMQLIFIQIHQNRSKLDHMSSMNKLVQQFYESDHV